MIPSMRPECRRMLVAVRDVRARKTEGGNAFPLHSSLLRQRRTGLIPVPRGLFGAAYEYAICMSKRMQSI